MTGLCIYHLVNPLNVKPMSRFKRDGTFKQTNKQIRNHCLYTELIISLVLNVFIYFPHSVHIIKQL